MRYETYETREPSSYRAALITLTSPLVVIDFRQERISTAENSQANSLVEAYELRLLRSSGQFVHLSGCEPAAAGWP